jgi:hypothetical protein
MELIPSELKAQILKRLEERLTTEAVERIIDARLSTVVDECIAGAMESIEDRILDIVEKMDYKGIDKKARQLLAEQIEQRVHDRVSEISYWTLHGKMEEEAKRIIPTIVAEESKKMNVASIIREALEPAIKATINTPVSEIIKQQIGFIFDDFRNLKDEFHKLKERDQDLDGLMRRVTDLENRR